MTRLPLRPLIQLRDIDQYLAVRRHFHVRTVHGARRRALEVNSFAVVSAAVARDI